jgi:hypothetical protein
LITLVVVCKIILGALCESFIHPLTIPSTLPAGIGALAPSVSATRDIGDRHHRHHHDPSSKGGIMLVDFAIVAPERNGRRWRQSAKPACCGSVDPLTTKAHARGVP